MVKTLKGNLEETTFYLKQFTTSTKIINLSGASSIVLFLFSSVVESNTY